MTVLPGADDAGCQDAITKASTNTNFCSCADDAPDAFSRTLWPLSDLRADYADIRCPPMISRYCSFCGWNKKKTVLTPCFKICCLWYIPSHFLSHFSFGQMTQIVRRHQQPALCGTHQSQVCHCWCISIFNTNTTNRYKSIHTYVCGSSVVFWNSLISIPCFYPLWCWWHKKIITSRGTTVWFNQTDCPFFLHHCRLDLVFVKRAFQ